MPCWGNCGAKPPIIGCGCGMPPGIPMPGIPMPVPGAIPSPDIPIGGMPMPGMGGTTDPIAMCCAALFSSGGAMKWVPSGLAPMWLMRRGIPLLSRAPPSGDNGTAAGDTGSRRPCMLLARRWTGGATPKVEAEVAMKRTSCMLPSFSRSGPWRAGGVALRQAPKSGFTTGSMYRGPTNFMISTTTKTMTEPTRMRSQEMPSMGALLNTSLTLGV
mmetsp:Transcript_28089/g.66447  ORF Transcript_28089/g.66447 Transcript_28089/m.66447 type:complete len:215 (+) Transcript_28089:160-804(+)